MLREDDMRAEIDPPTEHDSESDPQGYPFGLTSRQLLVIVVLGGLIGPGLLVNALESVNLSVAADLVWIGGYGGTILVVWYMWLRPLNLGGSAGQDASFTHGGDQIESEDDLDNVGTDTATTAESQSKESTPMNGDMSQVSANENQEASESN
ncbi:hypothetical protein [Halorhabdus rudnickae]|uniref:hypothetical protein n=1 Tax=Halorhabdus rudnickae TaxID=1775544 RepID=UPI0014385BE1|nr:hypothetical protein [Halorhabdus rudnickae]